MRVKVRVSRVSEDDAVTKLAVREAVCTEGWKQASDQFSRIEVALGEIVLLLIFGEGSVVQVLRRLIGG